MPSRERTQVALYEVQAAAVGLTTPLQTFQEAVAGQFQSIADDEAQRLRNAELIFRAIRLLPSAQAYRLDYSGGGESCFKPPNDVGALLLRRTTVQHEGNPYFVVGANRKTSLYVPAAYVVTRSFVKWAKDYKERKSIYGSTPRWRCPVEPGRYGAHMLYKADPARQLRGLPTPKELVRPADPDELAVITEAKKRAHGQPYLKSPEWEGRGKFHWLEEGISSADMERYGVLGRLTILTGVFGKATRFADILEQYKAELPAQKPGSEAEPTALAQLEARLAGVAGTLVTEPLLDLG